jgi:hypothetical protein
MYGAADLVAEQAIEELVLLDPRKPGESFINYLRAKMVSSARKIDDRRSATRQRTLDPLFHFTRGRHND